MIVRARGGRKRNRFPAAASPSLIWILERKARLELTNREIEPRAEQEHHIFRRYEDFDALIFYDFVAGLNVGREIHCVGHARATAIADANPQTCNRLPGRFNERAGARGGRLGQRHNSKA